MHCEKTKKERRIQSKQRGGSETKKQREIVLFFVGMFSGFENFANFDVAAVDLQDFLVIIGL
jgi:hypothetical protein